MLLLDFSTAGWKAATKEFFASAFKTGLVAIAAYVTFRLSSVEIDLQSQNAELYTIFLIVGRALVSSFKVWATTLPGTIETPAGTPTQVDPLV